MNQFKQDIDSDRIERHKEIAVVEKTREMFLNEEQNHVRREEMPFTPDPAGMNVSNAEQRQGRPMDHKRMMKLLKKCNSNLYFEQSISSPDRIGIYVIVNPSDYPTDYKLYKGRLLFVTGMSKGVMPEFSIIEAEVSVRPDPYGVEDPQTGERVSFHNSFKEEKRGWRTVLFNLLKSRMISEPLLEKHFKISLGPQSGRWHQMTHTPIELLTEETILNGGINGDQGNDRENGDGSGAPGVGRQGQLGRDLFDFRGAKGADVGFRSICDEGGDGTGRGDAGEDRQREETSGRQHGADAGRGENDRAQQTTNATALRP